MVNFKAGDRVRRVNPVPYLIKRTTGIQKDGIYTVGEDYGKGITLEESYQRTFTFHASCFELAAAIGGDGELPPAPESGLYFNHDGTRSASLKLEEETIALGTNASILKVRLTPETALDLAYDLRRMAMEIRRKEKQG